MDENCQWHEQSRKKGGVLEREVCLYLLPTSICYTFMYHQLCGSDVFVFYA